MAASQCYQQLENKKDLVSMVSQNPEQPPSFRAHQLKKKSGTVFTK
jgi:hypothetical protein